MSHTKGTWQQSASIIYCGNAVICALSEPRKTEHIEYYPLEIGSPDWQEAMDNGKLIKAAPALLAALEKIAAGNPARPGKWLSDVEMADIARAAIADARGEQAEGE